MIKADNRVFKSTIGESSFYSSSQPGKAGVKVESRESKKKPLLQLFLSLSTLQVKYRETGWAGSDDGILVRDLNSDGVMNDGKELFGDHTLLNNGSNAANGFQALSELDTNIDGKVDANDTAWSSLKIWQDSDGDGYKRKARGQRQGDRGAKNLSPIAPRPSPVC